MSQANLSVRSHSLVSQLTGPGASAGWDRSWNVSGTDLGFSFEHRGQLYMVFGDTWGRDGTEGRDWRSNVMAIAQPEPGGSYAITGMVTGRNGEARELLPSMKRAKQEYTVIPTAGISIGDRMYLHYMSIRDWEDTSWGYKHPALNSSGFAYSDDGGETWVKDDKARWPGGSGFGQAAMVEDGGYVYVFGTPSGRFGAARLLRTPSDSLLEPERYEYWDGEGWSSDDEAAAEVVPAPVGEMSVRWSDYHGRWLMMYLNDVTHAIVLRTAEQPEGPWDDERVVVTAREYPTLYGPFMLPDITGPDIYFTMSRFDVYNVFMMKVRLEKEE